MLSMEIFFLHTQWNFIQPQRTALCYFQENGWAWRLSYKQNKSVSEVLFSLKCATSIIHVFMLHKHTSEHERRPGTIWGRTGKYKGMEMYSYSLQSTLEVTCAGASPDLDMDWFPEESKLALLPIPLVWNWASAVCLAYSEWGLYTCLHFIFNVFVSICCFVSIQGNGSH